MTSRFTIATCLLSTASCRLPTSHFNLPTQNSLPIRSLVHQSIGKLLLLCLAPTGQVTATGFLSTDILPLWGMLRHCGCCLVSVSYISINHSLHVALPVCLLLLLAYCQLPTAVFPLPTSIFQLKTPSPFAHWYINPLGY